jgi:hypothetical protein
MDIRIPEIAQAQAFTAGAWGHAHVGNTREAKAKLAKAEAAYALAAGLPRMDWSADTISRLCAVRAELDQLTARL